MADHRLADHSHVALLPLPRSDPVPLEPSNEQLSPEQCAELLRAVQCADKRIATDAFSALYRGLKHEVFTFVYRRVGNAADAEDLFHDIEVKVWKNIHRVVDPACFHRWVYRIAQRAIADYWRAKYAGADVPREVSLDAAQARRTDDSADLDVAPQLDLPDTRIDFDRTLDDLDSSALFQRAIRKLPKRLQECLILHCFQDLAYDEIAKRLGISSGAVARNINEGRQRLRVALCAEWQTEGITPREIASKLSKLKTASERSRPRVQSTSRQIRSATNKPKKGA